MSGLTDGMSVSARMRWLADLFLFFRLGRGAGILACSKQSVSAIGRNTFWNINVFDYALGASLGLFIRIELKKECVV